MHVLSLLSLKKRRSEVPTTPHMPMDGTIETVLTKIPAYSEMHNFSNENPSEGFMPANEEWEEIIIPILMQPLV